MTYPAPYRWIVHNTDPKEDKKESTSLHVRRVTADLDQKPQVSGDGYYTVHQDVKDPKAKPLRIQAAHCVGGSFFTRVAARRFKSAYARERGWKIIRGQDHYGWDAEAPHTT